jgi:hypothetical protein
MRLSLLLWALSLILRRAARRNRRFVSYVGGIHQVRVMIKTADGKRGRLFTFDRGRVSSRRGAGQPYDAAIVWADAGTAFRVMASGSDEASFLAAAEGKMKLDGMAFFAQWFNDAVRLAMRR